MSKPKKISIEKKWNFFFHELDKKIDSEKLHEPIRKSNGFLVDDNPIDKGKGFVVRVKPTEFETPPSPKPKKKRRLKVQKRKKPFKSRFKLNGSGPKMAKAKSIKVKSSHKVSTFMRD